MPQISIQPVAENLSPVGSAINLEVSTFSETRQAKLVTYSRAQAYLDTSLVIGAFNSTYEMTVIVPQDFVNAEDIETLLAGLQTQMQLLVDVEGEGDYVRITQVSPSHTGGQPQYYSVDITATSLGYPFVTRQIAKGTVGVSSASTKQGLSAEVAGEVGTSSTGTVITGQEVSPEIGVSHSAGAA
jgi:hypothetical protein